MSDENTNADAAAQAAAEAANQAAAEAAAAAAADSAATKADKKAAAKANKANQAAKAPEAPGAAEAPANKRYVSTEKHSYPFDMQIAGVILQGQWTRESGIVMFDVPAELVEGFEKHHHFQVGNLKAAAE